MNADIIERAERELHQETLRPWYMLLIQELVDALKKSRRHVRYLDLVIIEDLRDLSGDEAAELEELHKEFG